VNDLIQRLAAAGFSVELTESGPRLVPAAPGLRVPAELLAEVKRRRADVLHFLQTGREPETEGERCGVCNATVYHPSPELIRMCGMVTCPYWTEGSGVGPEWLAEARKAQAWADRKRAS
jgi:hypothetical protein